MHPRTARSFTAGAFALLAFAASSLHAQELQAPRLLADPGVIYPSALLAARVYERVEVPLLLELDETGQVTHARLELPGAARHEFEAGFDSGSGDPSDPEFDARSRGSAYGVELFLRRKLSQRFGGFVSYTLSRSQRVRDGEHYASAFDRPHVLNVAVSCELGAGWRSGARFLYYSGTPQEPASEADRDATHLRRYAAFHRLDLRLEKRWALGDRAWLAFVLEFLNAMLRRETWPGGEHIGPISIPSLGVEAGF